MIASYKCEICAFESGNKKAVERCEAKGKRNKFKLGQKVKAKVPGVEGEFDFVAVIKKISFVYKTHKVFYDIESKMKKTRYSRYYGIPETNLGPL